MAGHRADKALASRLEGFSRAELKRFIEAGRVLVNGEPIVPRRVLALGDEVSVRPVARELASIEAEDLPLEIVHEDEQVIVVNKAAGMVMHPAPGHPRGTLVNAVAHHSTLAGGDPERPGIVHRLDKDTSGLVVVAKTSRAHASLVEQWQARTVDREYVAIALGAPRSNISYETLHGRHPKDRKRFTTKVREGKHAVTHMTRLEALHASALVSCRLDTGRTHQIRVHLSEGGFPLLADPIYGRAPRDPRLRSAAEAIGRLALHAKVLGFDQPETGERLRFELEPPEPFQAALALLRD